MADGYGAEDDPLYNDDDDDDQTGRRTGFPFRVRVRRVCVEEIDLIPMNPDSQRQNDFRYEEEFFTAGHQYWHPPAADEYEHGREKVPPSIIKRTFEFQRNVSVDHCETSSDQLARESDVVPVLDLPKLTILIPKESMFQDFAKDTSIKTIGLSEELMSAHKRPRLSITCSAANVESATSRKQHNDPNASSSMTEVLPRLLADELDQLDTVGIVPREMISVPLLQGPLSSNVLGGFAELADNLVPDVDVAIYEPRSDQFAVVVDREPNCETVFHQVNQVPAETQIIVPEAISCSLEEVYHNIYVSYLDDEVPDVKPPQGDHTDQKHDCPSRVSSEVPPSIETPKELVASTVLDIAWLKSPTSEDFPDSATVRLDCEWPIEACPVQLEDAEVAVCDEQVVPREPDLKPALFPFSGYDFEDLHAAELDKEAQEKTVKIESFVPSEIKPEPSADGGHLRGAGQDKLFSHIPCLMLDIRHGRLKSDNSTFNFQLIDVNSSHLRPSGARPSDWASRGSNLCSRCTTSSDLMTPE